MTAKTRHARLRPDTHYELKKITDRIGGTADDAIRHLLGNGSVRLKLTEGQFERWVDAAEQTGLTLEQFVIMRVEACLQFGTDGAAIQRILNGVDALCRSAGLQPRHVDARSTRP